MSSESSDGGLTLGLAVDGDSHGSRLLSGLVWVRTGTEPVSWAADDVTYETYYVHTGSLSIRWSGVDSGESTLHAGEFFYFAPGHTYTIENAGAEDVFLVWAITPRMPGS